MTSDDGVNYRQRPLTKYPKMAQNLNADYSSQSGSRVACKVQPDRHVTGISRT